MKILVSACLLGENCKYNGKNNFVEEIAELEKSYTLIPVCPEELGGLTTPRPPAEIIFDNGLEKVVTKDGDNVSENFFDGANKTLEKALLHDCKFAILKDGSPSCGSTYIYDGTFSKTKILGTGITAQLLQKNGIQVFSENNFKDKI